MTIIIFDKYDKTKIVQKNKLINLKTYLIYFAQYLLHVKSISIIVYFFSVQCKCCPLGSAARAQPGLAMALPLSLPLWLCGIWVCRLAFGLAHSSWPGQARPSNSTNQHESHTHNAARRHFLIIYIVLLLLQIFICRAPSTASFSSCCRSCCCCCCHIGHRQLSLYCICFSAPLV